MNFQDAPAQERASRPGTAWTGHSFERIADDLRRSAEAVCHHLLPGGKKHGHEFEASNLRGGWSARSKSLSVNLNTGIWKDFSSGEAGADLINLWAAVKGLDQGAAKAEAEDWLGIGPAEAKAAPAKPVARIAPPGPPRLPPDPAPEPDPAIVPDENWWRGESAARIWTYTDKTGEVFGQVYRFEHPTIRGVKAIRPWNGHDWKMPEGQRPLYNLKGIEATEQPIVWAEGEKAADAVMETRWTATACMGGAQALAKTDWSPLRGRHVIAWPDNDKAGADALERLKEAAREYGFASLKVVTIPEGKPPKWDAADTDATERHLLIAEAYHSRPVITGRPQLRLSDWTADSAVFKGAPPARQWLVRETFPLGSACLLAAMGDMGKGMLILDLALKVACGAPSIMGPTAFGCTVDSFGKVVILSAEDDQAEMHRRLVAIDRDNLRRGDRAGNLHLIPLPNVGGAFPLVKHTAKGLEVTEEFTRLRDQMLEMENLRLIVIDPLSSFIQADLNSDSAAASFVCQQVAMLAAETGACVIMAHHVRKDSPNGNAIASPEAARAAIRGQSGLVDGVRAAFVLWHAPELDARKACKAVGREYRRNTVVHGAVVKTNGPADRGIRTFIRDRANGLLVDHTQAVQPTLRFERSEIQAAMISVIEKAAQDGQPFTKTGNRGMFENLPRLPEMLRSLGRDRIRREIDNLLASGKIVKALASGRAAQELDVPNGPYAKGVGQVSGGAQPIYGNPEKESDDEAADDSPA